MGQERAIREIEKLRKLRAPKARDLTIAKTVEDAVRAVRSRSRTLDRTEKAWRGAAPERFTRIATATRLVRGTLTIEARTAAASYEIQRWLREGGLADLRRVSGVTGVTVIVADVGEIGGETNGGSRG